jgi:DNA-binding response OmpR family regulator
MLSGNAKAAGDVTVPDTGWRAPLSAYGSALVALDEPRATQATVLVLQEMGLTVDVVADLPSALYWVEAADYEIVVCAARVRASALDFVQRLRYFTRDTRVLMFATAGFDGAGFEELGVELLAAPVDVNRLVERVWPSVA